MQRYLFEKEVITVKTKGKLACVQEAKEKVQKYLPQTFSFANIARHATGKPNQSNLEMENKKTVNPLTLGGTDMEHKKPIFLSMPGLQGLIMAMIVKQLK